MNQPSAAFCPQCKQEVVFVKKEGKSTCPSCGFEYVLSAPVLDDSAGGENGPELPWWRTGFVRGMLKAILIMFILAVVGLAVAFAGCVFGFR